MSPFQCREVVDRHTNDRHCPHRLLQQIEQTVPGDERGDLLVFLAGMEDISTVTEHLREHAQRSRRWLVLPLHSALSVEEQDKVK